MYMKGLKKLKESRICSLQSKVFDSKFLVVQNNDLTQPNLNFIVVHLVPLHVPIKVWENPVLKETFFRLVLHDPCSVEKLPN